MSAIPAVSTTRPCRSTVTRSAAASASSSLCVMSTAAPPRDVKRRITPRRSPTSAGASTAVGSSSRRNRASAASAFTISSRCLRATLRCSTRASGSRGRPARSLASFTRRRSRAGATGHPAVSATFSATVNAGTDVKCWWTIPIPSRRASRGESPGRATSSTSTTPASGWRRPAAICMRVVLPAPFSPRSAWTSPGGNVKSAPRNACTEPNLRWIPRSSSPGIRGRSDDRGTPTPGRSGRRGERRAPGHPGFRWRSDPRRSR